LLTEKEKPVPSLHLSLLVRPLLVLGLLWAALLGAGAPVADAGTYQVWACADGSEQPIGVGDWQVASVGAQSSAASSCGTPAGSSSSDLDGALVGSMHAAAARGPAQANAGAYAEWSVRAAPDTRITRLDVWWHRSAVTTTDVNFAYGVLPATFRDTEGEDPDGPGHGQPAVPGSSLWVQHGSYGNPLTPFSDTPEVYSDHGAPFANRTHTTLVAPSGEGSLSMRAACLSGCAFESKVVLAGIHAYRTKLTVSDDAAPSGGATGVAAGQVLDAPATLSAHAEDRGGGVHDLQLLVDGRIVDSHAAAGRCADIDPVTGDERDYAAMRPCPAALPTTFALTASMFSSAGLHTIQVDAHDAAGNATTLAHVPVAVAASFLAGAAPVVAHAPLPRTFLNPDLVAVGGVNGATDDAEGVADARMTLAFVTHRRLSRRRTVSFRTAARVRGRLLTARGRPIVGARVWPAVSVAGGPWRLSGGALVTSARGGVSFVAAARKPSRVLALVYFPRTDARTDVVSPTVSYDVRAPVTLTLSRRTARSGQRVVATARLHAGQRHGQAVLGVLQVYKPQGPQRGWHSYRQVRFPAEAGGVRRLVLRLRTPTTYRLRVRVSRQAALRYESGASRARALRITS
jgi:hypothetical protein